MKNNLKNGGTYCTTSYLILFYPPILLSPHLIYFSSTTWERTMQKKMLKRLFHLWADSFIRNLNQRDFFSNIHYDIWGLSCATSFGFNYCNFHWWILLIYLGLFNECDNAKKYFSTTFSSSEGILHRSMSSHSTTK